MIKETRFYKAKNQDEVLYHLKNVSNLVIYGGGTSIKTGENYTLLDIGEDCLFISNNPDLNKIEKHERYIDFGSAVTLTQILNLGETNIPIYIYQAISSVANPLIRNSATMVGNICCKDHYHTLYSPLLAVDAKLEIHNSDETLIVPMSKFSGIKKGELITKLRLPIIDWDIANFTRLGPCNAISDASSSFTFLSKSQKDILIDIRIAFCGKIKIKSNELENNLIGCHLPLSEKQINNEIELAEELFDSEVQNSNKENSEKLQNMALKNPMIKEQFLNLLKKNLVKLT